MSVDPQSQQGKTPEEAAATEPEIKEKQSTGCEGTTPPVKNIFVFCDGTGNEFATRQSCNGNSNVVKLYTALHLDETQIAYYHPGVGTLGDPNEKSAIGKKLSIVKGLAFGYGFRENVLDAYRYLMQHYASGDRVYILGFSRGAYTARALAGLLHGYGLLCRGNEGHIPYAWRMYTERVATQREINAHTIKPDTTFRDTFSHPDFTIHFIGLWDTVSSIGWISEPLRLLDLAQNSTIQRGRHAVSIDERRCFYQDNLFGRAIDVDLPMAPHNKKEAANILKHQDLQQVWFPGVHSDVGGSYPQLQSGLANVALEWMIKEVEKAGAKFDPGRTAAVFGEPREPQPENAALAALYEKPNSYMLHKSLHGIWWLLELLPHRYYDTDNAEQSMRIPFGAYRKIPPNSLIHPSVRERLKSDPCYRPQNITLAEIGESTITRRDADGEPYLRFKPSVCRDGGLLENWLFVFAVAVLEWIALVWALIFVVLGLCCFLRCRFVHYLASVVWHWLRYCVAPCIHDTHLLVKLGWIALLVFVVLSITRLIRYAKAS